MRRALPLAVVCACLSLLGLGATRQRAVRPILSQLTAFPDFYSVGQGKSLSVNAARGVLTNDRDPQNKSLIAILAANPMHGTLTFNPDGSFIYTNDGTGASTDAFSYQASNGTTRSDVAIVTITIGAAESITANPDAYSLPHGGTVNVAAPGVLGNDTDPAGAALVAQLTTSPSHGQLTLNGNGSLTYTHDGSNTTSDSFAYRATNGVLTSTVATVTFTIGADVPPTVASQRYTTTQNVALTVPAPGVLTGAADPDSATITAVLQTSPAHGSVTLSANGSFTYTPSTGYVGDDSFTYAGNDGILNSTSPATATISIAQATTPSAVDDRYTATSSTLTIAAPGVLGNDTTNGASIRSFGSTGIEQNGIGLPAITNNNGQVTLNATGGFTYAPPSAVFSGEDSFRYVIANASGSSTATVTILVLQQCGTITIGPAVLPSAVAGTAYSALALSQSGGKLPVTWTSGAMPAGTMSLSSAGVLSGTPSAAGTYNIAVTVTDANSCTATKSYVLTVSGCPTVTISRPPLTAGTEGVSYSSVTFEATGGLGPYTWTPLAGLPPGLGLSPSGILSGTPSASGTFHMTVQAADANGCSVTASVTLVIDPPSAAGCPAITIAPSALPAGKINSAYAVLFSQTGGTSPVTWTATGTPAGLAMAANGVLSGTPAVTGAFDVVVTATDANNCVKSKVLPLTIATATCSPINIIASSTIAPSTLPNGLTGSAYGAITFTGTGGTGTLTWSVASGTLPPGLTLTSAGSLSGTTTASGPYTFSINATDANGCSSSRSFTLTVSCPIITMTTPPLPAGTVGTAYGPVALEASGGAPPYTWANLTPLPGGLNLTSGTISGTPTVSGTFHVSLRATDQNNCTAAGSVTLVIDPAGSTACPAISITPSTLSSGRVNVAFAQQFTQVGGAGQVTWAATGAPAGVTMSTSGVLSGTPTVSGTFDVVVTVTDANNCTKSKIVPLTIQESSCPPIAIAASSTISASTLPNGMAGTPYGTIAFTATGGTGPLIWTVDSGMVPGLQLASTGNLVGTPTKAGAYTFSVKVTDANSCSSSQSFTLTVTCPVITMTTPPLPAATINTLYPAASLGASGGVAPYTWTAVPTTALPSGLPAGLNLVSGAISGTPTVSGTFTVNVKATDSNLCIGTGSMTLVIDPAGTGCPAIAISPASLANGQVGSPYSAQFTQTGGSGSVTWTASGPSGTGLTMATNGILSGTPTASGAYEVIVTVTDANNCAKSKIVPLKIAAAACTPIAITASSTIPPSTLPNGTVGASYGAITFSGSGNIGTLTWAATSGTLPAGLSLSSAGILSGTPTASGTHTFTVTATDDASGCSSSQSFTLAVTCPVITMTTPPLPAGTINTLYGPVSLTASGGVAPYLWTATSLPSGLSLASGVIAGTPTVSGTFHITVQAQDQNNCTAGATLTLVIDPAAASCPAIAISPSTISNGQAGSAYTALFTQSGGATPVNWTATSVPTGLTMTAGGVLTGTPTVAGKFDVVVTVTDKNSCTRSKVVPLTIVASSCPAIAINASSTTATSTLPSGAIGTAYSAITFSATGGMAPLTWSLRDPALLPTGLAFTTTTVTSGTTTSTLGSLSGTPNIAGTVTITVVATDANGCRGERSFTLTVCNTISVGNPLNHNGKTETPFSEQFTQGGGIGAVTFTTASLLPSGLTLSASGLLAGTPHQLGTFSVAVVATDASGCTGTGSTYPLQIVCGTIAIVNPALTTATLSAALPSNTQFTATGGTGTIAYTIESGTLPTGVTLTTGGVLTGAPVQAGTFDVTVRATDTNGCHAVSQPYHLNVPCQTITITSALTATKNYNESFNIQLTATGGSGPLTWQRVGNVLPYGVSFSSSGLLSGAATEAGDFPVNLRVSDTNGCPKDFTFTLTIVASCASSPITVSLQSGAPSATVGTSYPPSTFNATGGASSKSYQALTTLFGGISSAEAIVADTFGNVYIADTGNNAIEKWRPNSGVTTTLVNGLFQPAGLALRNGIIYFSDRGTSTLRSVNGGDVTTLLTANDLDQPSQIAMDGAGNIYIADTGHNAVKKWLASPNVSPRVTTIATGLSTPIGIAVDQGGTTVYFSELAAGMIRKCTSIPCTQPQVVISGLQNPRGMTMDGAGNLYFCHGGNTATANKVQMVTPAGTLKTLLTNDNATSAAPFATVAIDGLGRLYVSDYAAQGQVRILGAPPGFTMSAQGTLAGTPTIGGTLAVGSGFGFPMRIIATDANGCQGSYQFNLVVTCNPFSVTGPATATVSAGQVVSADFNTPGMTGPVTWSISGAPPGISINQNGTVGGSTTTAATYPIQVSATATNNCGTQNATFSLIVSSCSLTMTAANATISSSNFSQQFSVTGGSGNYNWTVLTAIINGTNLSGAIPNGPSAIAVDSSGNVYASDPGHQRIVMWQPSGAITAIVNNVTSYGLAVAPNSNALYYSDQLGNRIMQLALPYNSGNSPAIVQSGFNNPLGITVDGGGNVWVADNGTGSVKKIVGGNTIQVTASSLSNPQSVAVGSTGALYVATGSNIVSCSTPPCEQPTTLLSGLLNAQSIAVRGTTLYFEQTSGGAVQTLNLQTGAVSTLFHGTPSTVAVDGSGNVYYGDWVAQLLWKATGSGTATPWGPTITNGGLLQGPTSITGTIYFSVYAVDAALTNGGCFVVNNYSATTQ